MQTALTILGLYALVVLATKIYSYIRNKKMLTLQAMVTAIRVNGSPLGTDDIVGFDKSQHPGAKIDYDIQYQHPTETEKTTYTVTEIVFVKENALIERSTIPTSGPFDILADPQNPNKIDVGVEFKLKGMKSKYEAKNKEMLRKFKK